MNANNYKKGQEVYFGRRNGEKTLARVTRVNRKTITVVTLEPRGLDRRPAGAVWRVPYSLVNPKTEGRPAPRTAPRRGRRPADTRTSSGHTVGSFAKGDRVWWISRYGERKEGVVIRVSKKTVSVAANLHCAGYTRVSPGLLRFQGQSA
jgi:hypothetical protein